MTTSISDLKRDTFGIVLSFLSPRDWGRTSKVCKTWNKYVNNSNIAQITIFKRLPKILQQNLPNCKLPILQIGGVVVDPNLKTFKPFLRFGGEENCLTNKIDIVTPDMMSAPIMFVKDSLNRVGVAVKYTHKILFKLKEERVIVLHEVGGKHKGIWTSGQDRSDTKNAKGYVAWDTYTGSRRFNSALLQENFPENWNNKETNCHIYLSRLLKGESCGLLKVEVFENVERIVSERTPDNNTFIRLSP